MTREDEIYIPEKAENRDCIMFIIRYYYDIMIKQLKAALDPWKESLANVPIELKIMLGEYKYEQD